MASSRIRTLLPTGAQVRAEAPAIAIGLLAGAVVVGFSVLGGVLSGRTTFFLMHEAQEVLDGPWYAGAGSILTGLLWWTAATAAAVAAIVLRGRRAQPFLIAAALSAALALDDLLRLHEVALPELIGLGEKYLTVGYLVAYLVYAVSSLGLSARHGRIGLLVVLGLLGLSAGADFVLQGLLGGELTLLEDGSKTLGAALWAAVQVRFAVRELRPASAGTGSQPAPTSAAAAA